MLLEHRRIVLSPSSLLIASLLLSSTGCGAAGKSVAVPPEVPRPPETPASEGMAAAFQASPAGMAAAGLGEERSLPANTTGAPASTTGAPATVATNDPELARAKQMVDIEAHLRIEVERVPDAAERLRRIIAASGGRVANEATSTNAGEAEHAEFTLRIPVDKADGVFAALDGLGVTRARNVTARDVGKDYYDSVLRLRNLGVTRDRLEEVLKHATEVKDILTVEGELSRVRGEMEQIEGQLRYLRDRAAFATIFVNLFVRPSSEPVVAVEVKKPEAKFFPGLAARYLLDVHGDGSTASYYGAGLSVGLSRQFDLHLDAFRRFDHESGAFDAVAATIGGRFYSEYLGGGTRRFLDPYLGLRGGYARFEARNEIATGATLGVELWKTETVRLDLGADALVLFGSHAGAHATLSPSLSFDVAF